MQQLAQIVVEQRRLDILHRLHNHGQAYFMRREPRHEFGLKLLRDAIWSLDHDWPKCAADLMAAAHEVLEAALGDEGFYYDDVPPEE